MTLYTFDVEITIKENSELKAEMILHKMAEENDFQLGAYQLKYSSKEEDTEYVMKYEKFLESIDHEKDGEYFTFDVDLTVPAEDELKAEMKMQRAAEKHNFDLGVYTLSHTSED